MSIFKALSPLTVLFSLSVIHAETVIETQFLEQINKHRSSHGCPDLRLSSEMSNAARDYAWVLGTKGTMEHSTPGESLCTLYGDPLKCVDEWYAEERFYDYEEPVFVERSEDFTQMIWKASEFLGIGLYNDTSEGKIIVVARYHPAGNIDGSFTTNVLKPSQRSNNSNKYMMDFFELIHFMIFVILYDY